MLFVLCLVQEDSLTDLKQALLDKDQEVHSLQATVDRLRSREHQADARDMSQQLRWVAACARSLLMMLA